MKYFLDTEFITYPGTIDLVSIGIVSENDRYFYAISSEYDETKASEWVKNNVINKLGNDKRKTKIEIAKEILAFIGSDENPEFWAFYGAFDWVVFMWIFGGFDDKPVHFPFYCKEIRQLEDSLCLQAPRQETGHHHALEDAKWNKSAYFYLTK